MQTERGLHAPLSWASLSASCERECQLCGSPCTSLARALSRCRPAVAGCCGAVQALYRPFVACTPPAERHAQPTVARLQALAGRQESNSRQQHIRICYRCAWQACFWRCLMTANCCRWQVCACTGRSCAPRMLALCSALSVCLPGIWVLKLHASAAVVHDTKCSSVIAEQSHRASTCMTEWASGEPHLCLQGLCGSSSRLSPGSTCLSCPSWRPSCGRSNDSGCSL